MWPVRSVRKKETRINLLNDQGNCSFLPILPILPAMAQQSRLMSFVEAVSNVVVGYLLAVVTQLALFPMFGLVVSVADNVLIGGVFTAVSLVRSYMLRRLFEALRRGSPASS